jgi:YHS domain-containing protein
VRVALLAIWVVMALVALLPIFRHRSLPNDARRLETDELVKDPVCQTYIVRSRAVSRQTAAGPRYFCSAECAARFAG